MVEAQRTVAYVNGLSSQHAAHHRGPRRGQPRSVAGTTLSRHVLAELEALNLPRLQTAMSEAVAYGEISFSGTVPQEGTAAEEIAALMAELRHAGGLP